MSVSFNPTQATNSQIEVVENKKEEPKTSLFKIPSVKKLILGAFAVQGAAMMPKAEGGFLSFTACMAACSPTPVTPLGCTALCMPFMGLPV